MAKLKTDLSKDAKEWFENFIGYMPNEEDMEDFFRREPGYAKLIYHILDPQKYYQDYNIEVKKERRKKNG